MSGLSDLAAPGASKTSGNAPRGHASPLDEEPTVCCTRGMAYIELIPEEAAEGILEKVYAAARVRAGGVANIIKVMSRDPAVLQASMALYVNLMKAPNALPAVQREMMAAVVSNINDCYY